MIDFTVEKDEELGIYKGTMTVKLPEITVTRYKADRSDFKYEMQAALNNVVEAVIEKHLD